MAEALRSDGQAIDVTVTATVAKGAFVLANGFHGFACNDAVSGDTIALDISQREFEFTCNGPAAAVGDVLYLNTSGAITTTNTDKPFVKVTRAKDSNNIVWGIQLPQVNA